LSETSEEVFDYDAEWLHCFQLLVYALYVLFVVKHVKCSAMKIYFCSFSLKNKFGKFVSLLWKFV